MMEGWTDQRPAPPDGPGASMPADSAVLPPAPDQTWQGAARTTAERITGDLDVACERTSALLRAGQLAAAGLPAEASASLRAFLETAESDIQEAVTRGLAEAEEGARLARERALEICEATEKQLSDYISAIESLAEGAQPTQVDGEPLGGEKLDTHQVPEQEHPGAQDPLDMRSRSGEPDSTGEQAPQEAGGPLREDAGASPEATQDEQFHLSLLERSGETGGIVRVRVQGHLTFASMLALEEGIAQAENIHNVQLTPETGDSAVVMLTGRDFDAVKAALERLERFPMHLGEE